MDHFEFKVGNAVVQVHQAFECWANPFIRIKCDGQEKTLIIDKKEQNVDIEIVKQTS